MAGAGDGDALIIISFMKASSRVKLPTPLNTSGGNPRSADRMLAAFMCRNPLSGGILGGALGFAGPADGFFGGAVLHPSIHGDGSSRRGAVQIRSEMWEDGLAQEDDAVWRRWQRDLAR